MALYLTEEDVRQLLSMEMALEAVEVAFKDLGEGRAQNLPRRRVRGTRGGLMMMVAVVPSMEAMGYKAYGAGARMKVFLYGSETGRILAIMEANGLGQMRTGAATGVATKYMARPEAETVGLIGTGYQARSQLAAVCAVRPIRQVRAYSRTAEGRERFSQEMSQSLGLEVRAAESVEEAVRGSEIVITATTARDPVLRGALLEPGQHLSAVGANSLSRRELDEQAVARAEVVVVDSREQALLECGDLVFAVDRGMARWEEVRELAEVVAGYYPGRRSPEGITLFESQGLALEDVAVARRVYDEALRRGLGQELPFS